MNILATIIASYGLFANSPAVVIGAMVVALLIQPIIATSLALVENNPRLLLKALISEIVGVIIVYVTALIIGLIHRDIPVTNEIIARTAPNFIDLMIALAGGSAGALALLTPSIGLSLVGVAIATALVPPLSASAILLSRGEYILAGGAFMLAFVNLVAIQFSSSISIFLTKQGRGNTINLASIKNFLLRESFSIIVLLVLGIILTANLRNVVADQFYKTAIRKTIQEELVKFPGSYLADVRFEIKTGVVIVRAVVRGPHELTPNEVASIEAKLPTSLK